MSGAGLEDALRTPGLRRWGPREAPPSEPSPSAPHFLSPSEPCGFEATYLELANAVKEEYPGIEIESRLGGTGEARGRAAESGRALNPSPAAPGWLLVQGPEHEAPSQGVADKGCEANRFDLK